jgi:hypothetical protein
LSFCCLSLCQSSLPLSIRLTRGIVQMMDVRRDCLLYSQGGGKKNNVVYPLDVYQEVKITYFDRIDTRIAGKLRFYYHPLHYTVVDDREQFTNGDKLSAACLFGACHRKSLGQTRYSVGTSRETAGSRRPARARQPLNQKFVVQDSTDNTLQHCPIIFFRTLNADHGSESLSQ